jgi:pimeloyl-ACP methyl ester carboxylesterase
MRRLLAAAAAGITVSTLIAGGPALGATRSEATRTAGTTTATTTTSDYVPPAPSWGTCADQQLREAGAQCAMVSVPLDYSRPKGEKIQLAISRMRHTSPASKYQGVMLVNPGGPGGSGLIFSLLQGSVPRGAGLTYDWIGFDPRGVGMSRPSLSCDGHYFGYNRPSYVPLTKSIEQAWLTKTKNYANACADAGGRLLDHMKTTDTVADMDSIRAALGAKKINFYGFSYGTYLGQVYATLHPERVGRMVLDGVINPNRVWWQSNLDQDFAFDKVIGMFFDWVAKHDAAYGLGSDGADVERTYYKVLSALRHSPQAGGRIGPSEWNDAFVLAGYGVFAWDAVARAFAAAVNDGNYAPIKAIYDAFQGTPGPGADNGYAVYLAVICTDAPWPRAWETWREVNWRVHKKAPFLTWNNAWYNAPCRTWKGDVGTPVRVKGSKAPPILLVSETFDAATPFSGALAVRRMFSKSRLIEGVGGTTHAASLSGIACTDGAIAAYLATGALPDRRSGNRSDLKCDPLPPPQPSTSSAASGQSRAATGLAPARLVLRHHLLGSAR